MPILIKLLTRRKRKRGVKSMQRSEMLDIHLLKPGGLEMPLLKIRDEFIAFLSKFLILKGIKQGLRNSQCLRREVGSHKKLSKLRFFIDQSFRHHPDLIQSVDSLGLAGAG